MLNFIYGALTMWFVLGGIILLCDIFSTKQIVLWDVWFGILITFPFFITFLPLFLFFMAIKKIEFNWNHDWKWKFEAIKEKIKYRH